MDFLSNLVAPLPAAVTAQDSLQAVLDTIATSSRIEDRIVAVKALYEIVKDKADANIGTKVLPYVLRLLESDRDNVEVIKPCLEILIATTSEPSKLQEESASLNHNAPSRILASILVENPRNVTLLLHLMQDNDFYVRYHTIKVLSNLLAHRSRQLQDAIMGDPEGIAILMDVMKDRREIIRNEVLPFMSAVTRSNQTIQKIVAFNGAFEFLIEVIQTEGLMEGGVISHDCLVLLNNLLRNNASNQNYFRETGLVPCLAPILAYAVQAADMIDAQRERNVALVLETVQHLVQSDGAKDTRALLCSSGAVASVVTLALSPQHAELQIQALRTLGTLIRLSRQGQAIFANYQLGDQQMQQQQQQQQRHGGLNGNANSSNNLNSNSNGNNSSGSSGGPNENPDMNALVRILLICFNGSTSAVRAAAKYVFQSYLHDNKQQR